MITVRCSSCGGKVTDVEGYPTVAAAMRDLDDHGIEVRGDPNDPKIRCQRCATGDTPPSTPASTLHLGNG